ncbi:MAG: hypothetical protein IIB64_05925, partial [Proteobacteria bacterium]|nr:hypothetical protein [Pseudomonadota bacterium]
EHPGIFGTFLYGKAQKRTAYEKVHYYVNSLEAFYDLRISDPLLPTEEFEPLKKEILSLLSKNLKKEIKEIFNTKISFLNSASLKVKLDKIFFRFSFIDQNISKFAKSFSKEIVAVRNFQSHGTLGKKIPTSRQNIIILSYLLEMYSIVCLLNILGYKEDFISKFCKRLDFFHSLESSAKNSKT